MWPTPTDPKIWAGSSKQSDHHVHVSDNVKSRAEYPECNHQDYLFSAKFCHYITLVSVLWELSWMFEALKNYTTGFLLINKNLHQKEYVQVKIYWRVVSTDSFMPRWQSLAIRLYIWKTTKDLLGRTLKTGSFLCSHYLINQRIMLHKVTAAIKKSVAHFCQAWVQLKVRWGWE